MDIANNLTDQMFIVIVNDQKETAHIRKLIQSKNAWDILSGMQALKLKYIRQDLIDDVSEKMHAYQLVYVLTEQWVYFE